MTWQIFAATSSDSKLPPGSETCGSIRLCGIGTTARILLSLPAVCALIAILNSSVLLAPQTGGNATPILLFLVVIVYWIDQCLLQTAAEVEVRSGSAQIVRCFCKKVFDGQLQAITTNVVPSNLRQITFHFRLQNRYWVTTIWLRDRAEGRKLLQEFLVKLNAQFPSNKKSETLGWSSSFLSTYPWFVVVFSSALGGILYEGASMPATAMVAGSFVIKCLVQRAFLRRGVGVLWCREGWF